jgi:muramoyltetrapeptide carboxypeptidase
MKILQPNSTIGIVAPAGALVETDLQKAIQFIENNHWKYKLGKNIFNIFQFGYNYSGTVQQRVEDFQSFLDDDEIDAIWCARGGYGGAQIIDKLNFTKFRKNPKYIIGYSDNTVLHQAINTLGFSSIHAITAKELPTGNTEKSYESLKTLLETGVMNYEISSSILNQEGKTKGILVGGNLSIIYSLLGSRTITDFRDKILFLEDWNENYYHIDRMMTGLKRAGVFNQLKGLIFGGFTKLDDSTENEEFNQPFDSFASKLLKSIVGKREYPIVFEFPSGHISENLALLFGTKVKLKVNNDIVVLKTVD